MNADTLQSSLTLCSSSPLLERLFSSSVELVGLATLVYVAIRVGRIRSARLAALLWLVVLAKPIVSLAIGSPLPLVRMELQPPAIATQPLIDTTQRVDRPAPDGIQPASPPDNVDERAAVPRAQLQPQSFTSPATDGKPMLPGVDAATATTPLASPVSSRPGRPATVILTIWLTGVAFFAGLSLRDRLRVGRLVRRARRPDPWLSDRYGTIMGQLGLKRPLELRITDAIEGPALVGSVFNTVLIPAWLADDSNGPKLDWTLRHELMHWKLRDPLAALVRELAQILFYFHPVAWWAGRQWKGAAEQACDRAIVTNDADSLDYAEQLYRILVGIRGRAQVPLRSGLFATRTQIGQRIAALVSGPRTAPHLNAYAIAGVAVVTAAALCVGVSFAEKAPSPSGGSSDARQAVTEPPAADARLNGPKSDPLTLAEAPPSNASPANPATDKNAIIIRGIVLGPDGKPFAGARLLWLRTRGPYARDYQNFEWTRAATSDGAGKFQLNLSRSYFNPLSPTTQVAAAADGFGIDWVDVKPSAAPAELTLRLVEDVPVRGRILDGEGRPVAGAKLSVAHLFATASGKLDGVLNAWSSVADEAIEPMEKKLRISEAGGPFPAVETGRDGRFEIQGLGLERMGGLMVKAPALAQTRINVVLRKGFDPRPLNETVRRRWTDMLRPGKAPVLFAPEFEFVGELGRIVQGTVREAGSGRPVAGALVRGNGGSGGLIWSTTDAQGWYRLEGMTILKRQYQLMVDSPEGSALLNHRQSVVSPGGSEPLTADVELARGIMITGRVIDRQTQQPLSAYVRAIPAAQNTFASQPRFRGSELGSFEQTSSADGEFRVVTVPGPVVLLAKVQVEPGPDGLRIDPYLPSADALDLNETSGRLRHDLFVDRGKTAVVRIEDPNGMPLAGTIVSGMTAVAPLAFRASDPLCTIHALDPAKPRDVLFYHPDRELAGHLVVRGDETQPLIVRLAPTSTVRGRAVDASGLPLRRALVKVYFAEGPAGVGLDHYLRERHPEPRTDDEGNFELKGFIADLPFTLRLQTNRVIFKPDRLEDLRRTIAAAAKHGSEVVDLGEVRVRRTN
jgi:beta-lactamase regulating signal transducer with metallopeptidase domain/protocatechuate 3,4-dioxygenase beta subunit